MATADLRFNSFVSAPERDRRNPKESSGVVWHLLKYAPNKHGKRGAGIMYSSPLRHHLYFLKINNIWVGNQILTEIFACRIFLKVVLVLIMIKRIV